MERFGNQRNKLTHQVYHQLREDIITLKLKPGTVLKEVELSQVYGLSRTPVREAIKQLKADTFVIFDPDVGNRVAPITIESYGEIYQIRESIELLATRLAAINATEDDLMQLEENLQKQRRMIDVKNRDFNEFFILDREFHSIIAQISGNTRLPSIVENYCDLYRRYGLYCTHKGQIVYTITEHEYIFKEIATQDVYGALDKMSTHLSNINEMLLLRL